MKGLRNPIFWGFIGFLGGIIIGAWGWDKYESTIPERTTGGLTMMIVGGAMILAGLLIFFIEGNKRKPQK